MAYDVDWREFDHVLYLSERLGGAYRERVADLAPLAVGELRAEVEQLSAEVETMVPEADYRELEADLAAAREEAECSERVVGRVFGALASADIRARLFPPEGGGLPCARTVAVVAYALPLFEFLREVEVQRRRALAPRPARSPVDWIGPGNSSGRQRKAPRS